jgi:phage shock protein PspC (stress-responsive transcriptional regulator)
VTEDGAATTPDVEFRRLTRPSEGRVLTGVSAGLAQYFGLHPLVYRVAFAALTLLDLAGVILYAAAWLVIPDERRGDSLVGEALRRRRERPWLAVGVGLVVLALAIGVVDGHFRWDTDLVWLGALVLGISLVYAETEYARQPIEESGATAPTAGSEGEPPAAAPRRGRRGDLGALFLPALGVVIAGIGILGVLDATDVLTIDWPLALASGLVLVGVAVAASATGALSALRSRRRRRYPVFLPTLGVLLTAGGVLGILDATDAVAVDWVLALAGSVVLIGLVVAVGAFVGRTGALAVIGLVLAAATIAAVTVELPLRGPIGERTARPLGAAALDDEYELSIGALTVDLRELELPSGTTRVQASVGIGELVVRVPDGVRVEAHAEVTAGETDVFGVRSDGWDVERAAVLDQAAGATPTLELDLEVGFGRLEVRR